MEVTDESAIPSAYKTLLLKLPAVTWEQLLDGLEIELRAAILGQVRSPEVGGKALDQDGDRWRCGRPWGGVSRGADSLRRS